MNSRNAVFVAACVLIVSFVGCITIPLGDPEKSKVDDKLVGAWISKPNEDGNQTLFAIVQYDTHTCMVSQLGFVKEGETIKPAGRFDWKMWLVDIKGTTFASLEMKNAQLAIEPQEERFASAKIKRDGDSLTIQPVKDDFVKNANITTSQQLHDLIADNLNSADLYGEPLTLTKVKDDQKEMVGKVFEAFTGGK